MGYLESLQHYEYDIKYFPGARNQVADSLSRRPYESKRAAQRKPPSRKPPSNDITTQDTITNVRINTTLSVAYPKEWIEEVQKGYQGDPYFGPIVRYLTYSPPDELDAAQLHKHIRKKFGLKVLAKVRRFALQEGILIHTDGNDKVRVCIPQWGQLRQDLLHEAHDTAAGGHFGAEKTY